MAGQAGQPGVDRCLEVQLQAKNERTYSGAAKQEPETIQNCSPHSPGPQPPAGSCSAGSTGTAPSPRLQPRRAGSAAQQASSNTAGKGVCVRASGGLCKAVNINTAQQ